MVFALRCVRRRGGSRGLWLACARAAALTAGSGLLVVVGGEFPKFPREAALAAHTAVRKKSARWRAKIGFHAPCTCCNSCTQT
jgi:NAD(P)-dependent dehydrogenase (short-subunit alcohol dehydrogenase family)